jgi:hypothetical protein
MVSDEGESFTFNYFVSTLHPIEEWMKVMQSEMRSTLKLLTK